MKLTKGEIELIEAIRNFKRAKHNPSKNLLQYIYDVLEKLLFG